MTREEAIEVVRQATDWLLECCACTCACGCHQAHNIRWKSLSDALHALEDNG